jgi:Ca2+-transporting ATPase
MERRAQPWSLPVPAALQLWESSFEGLAEAEIGQRRTQFGTNELPAEPRQHRLGALAQLVFGGLNLVLIVVGLVAALIGDVKSALMIATVITLNVTMEFLQERQAEKALAALKQMTATRARVRRDGQSLTIDAAQLVPGDVVFLEAGDRVPADGRLLQTVRFETDESSLTGESAVVAKDAQARAEPASPVADRENMAHLQTLVTRGHALMLVTATGAETEIGKLAHLMQGASAGTTPLQEQLNGLSKRMALVAVLLVAAIAGVEFLRGDPLMRIVLGAIALGVAAVPEGLPAVVTVTLALGAHRMARRSAIIRRLASVETLGCTTVICTDKTGTLTLNEMTVRKIFVAGRTLAVTGSGYTADGHIENGHELGELLRAVALCNDSQLASGAVLGDPTEGALLVLARKGGVEAEPLRKAHPRLAEIPFESRTKYMATFHALGGEIVAYVKGAPEVLLPLCAPPDDALRRANEALAGESFRVLAVACKPISNAAWGQGREPAEFLHGLRFLGLVGMIDPPRPDVRAAVLAAREAGVAVKMITGDQSATARAVAATLGIPGDVLTGAEIEARTDAELAAELERVGVFARVSPEHKMRLVRAFQHRGDVVAMTGDGVNDAPALKAADIGVAMGSGTEVSKQAAAMVLADDHFATMVKAIEEGRSIFDNILKFVRFQLSTNVGALATVAAAPLLGLPPPLNPAQVLWVAMIMDGPPAVALGLDPAAPRLMHDRPRDPHAPVLSLKRIGTVLYRGLIMCAGTLAALVWMLAHRPAAATTFAFTVFVFYQIVSALCVRSELGTAFSRESLTNGKLWLALALVAVLQVHAVQFGPLQSVFQTVPLTAAEWLAAAAAAASLLVLEELRKALARSPSR